MEIQLPDPGQATRHSLILSSVYHWGSFKSLLLTTSLTCETLGDISSKIAKIPLLIEGKVGPQGKDLMSLEQDPTEDSCSTLNLLYIKLLKGWGNHSQSRRNTLQDLYKVNSSVLYSHVEICGSGEPSLVIVLETQQSQHLDLRDIDYHVSGQL